MIWSGHTFEKLKTISQHGSHVKGITFDPANKYFATASDDRSVKIFRYTPPPPNTTAQDQTNNFMLEISITAPFVSSPLTTYFRRCSWSPDGNSLAAANAVNGQVPIAAVIQRGTWDSSISLIGHEGPTEVCAFSPRIFSKQAPRPNEPPSSPTTVLACAGQDRSLSLWDTCHTHPVYTFENLSTKAISDIAWCPDGESLFLTSLDGTITFAKFSETELGYPVPMEFNMNALARYGGGRKVGVIEGPEGLVLEERSKNDELRTVQGRMDGLMGDAASSAAPVVDIVMNGTNEKAATANISNKTTSSGTATAIPAPAEDSNAARIEKLKQRVTITKDGKKRVAPMLMSSAAAPSQSTLPQTQLQASVSRGSATESAPQSILDLSKPFDGLPKGGLSSLLFGNKRKLAETGADDDNTISTKITETQRAGATAILANTTEGLTLPNQAVMGADSNRPSIINSSSAMSQIRLAVPTVRALFTRSLSGPAKLSDTSEGSKTAPVDESPVMEVRNHTGPSRTGRPQDREPARITVTRKNHLLWQDFLPKAVVLVTGNSRYWAASCEDGSLYVWSPAGRRIFNAFALEAQTAILDCRGPWLLSITTVGLCHIWNISNSSAPHPPISVAPILDMAAQAQGPHLTNGPAIIFARLNSEGRVIVAMSNGDAYSYSASMFVWQRLSEAWWAVGSQYWNTSMSAQTSSSRGADAERTMLCGQKTYRPVSFLSTLR